MRVDQIDGATDTLATGETARWDVQGVPGQEDDGRRGRGFVRLIQRESHPSLTTIGIFSDSDPKGTTRIGVHLNKQQVDQLIHDLMDAFNAAPGVVTDGP